MNQLLLIFLLLILKITSPAYSFQSPAESTLKLPQNFIHPGLLQNREDLEYMKGQIQEGEKEWKEAFEILQANASLDFKPRVEAPSQGNLKDNTNRENREDPLAGWTTLEFEQEIKQLFERLDLDRPGMERVRAAQDNPLLAARELLAYYRERDAVKHPVDRGDKSKLQGKIASEGDLKVADNALQHIFVGQPAYPPFFCGEDIDWSTRPVKDDELVWQLNRMTFWDALAKAYWHTGNEKYAREWAFQLLDWVRKNPRDEEHQFAWRSIEAGIRGYRWTGLYQFFVDSPHFTPEVLVAFLNSFEDHASFLMSEYRKGSNWALMEAEGMAFIAINFPEFIDAPHWQKEAIGRLNHEITNQVYPDGHQRELAFGYHMGSIQWFMRTFELAKLNGLEAAFSEDYLQTIEKMCEVPMKLAFPDGTTPQFGDAWRGRPGQYYDQLNKWAEIFGRDDFKYVATEGREGKKPGATAFALPVSGLYSLRSGWDKDAVCLVLKCGPDGGGHSQPDNGTFELYAGGRDLMPDTGCFIYSGDPENRAWFRQTKVHQTLTLNGENSAYDSKLLLWKPGEDLDVLVVENRSYPKLVHRRAVLFVDKSYFIILDEAIGEGIGEVNLHFQLAPGDVDFSWENLKAQTLFEEGFNVLIQGQMQQDLLMEEEEGQVSFVYTEKESRPAFKYKMHKTKEKGIRFVTIVAPFEKTPPNLSVRILGNSPIGSTDMVLEIENKQLGNKKQLGYSINSVSK